MTKQGTLKATPKVELRKTGETAYRIFKNGKAVSKKYVSTGRIGTEVDINDALFSLPCDSLQEGEEFDFHINKDTVETWITIVTMRRKKNKLQIDFFASISGDKNCYYYLSEYVILSKIFAKASKYGLTCESELYEGDSFDNLSATWDTKGTLREKILKGYTILNKIKKEAEAEAIKMLNQGKLFCKIKTNR